MLKHDDERNAAAELVFLTEVASERAETIPVAGVIVPDFWSDGRFRGNLVMGRQRCLPKIAALTTNATNLSHSGKIEHGAV